MTELERARRFAQKRAQAERNIASHINTILTSAALQITKEARGLVFASSKGLFVQMMNIRSSGIINAARDEINEYIRAYAKASISVLGDKDTGATTRLLNSELFGRTFEERSEQYMQYFFYDVLNLIMAGRQQRLSQASLERVVPAQIKDPYTGTLITSANKHGGNIQTPAYGRGIYHSAYGNIIRNAQGVIAIAWGREERNFSRRNGAVGFRVHRGSDYPCELCQSKVGFVHPLTDDVPPFHVRCQCFIEYIYKNE